MRLFMLGACFSAADDHDPDHDRAMMLAATPVAVMSAVRGRYSDPLFATKATHRMSLSAFGSYAAVRTGRTR